MSINPWLILNYRMHNDEHQIGLTGIHYVYSHRLMRIVRSVVQSDHLHSHRKTELSGKIIRYILFSRVKYSNRNCGGILLAVAARTGDGSDLAFLSYVCLRCYGCAFS